MQYREIPCWKSGNAPLVLILILVACLLAGAGPRAAGASQPPFPPAPAVPGIDSQPLTVKGEQVRVLTTAIERLAVDLAASYRDGDFPHDPLAEGVVVSSFVELKNLARTSSFGRYLAEQLMGELQRQGHRVVELRKTVQIQVQERRGEFGLSRNAAEIPEAVASGALLTGTYTITDDHVLVNARIIDHRSAALLASATAIFPRDTLTRLLLADRVTAGGGGKEEMIYLKRLEP
jgi:TolB-like protein